MTPAAIALMCGVLYSPPASWDAVPLPASAQVIEVPMSELPALCVNVDHHYAAGHLYGCAYPDKLVAYVPTWATWPGTRQCWEEVAKRHEPDHLKGWKHP